MTEKDCLFCKIVAGEINADVVATDEQTVAFRDINPQAPTHILIVPRKHVATVNDMEEGDADMIGRLVLAARRIAEEEGLSEKGYRLTMNCMEGAGQSVFHVHLHLLGGRPFRWPPG